MSALSSEGAIRRASILVHGDLSRFGESIKPTVTISSWNTSTTRNYVIVRTNLANQFSQSRRGWSRAVAFRHLIPEEHIVSTHASSVFETRQPPF